MLEPVLTWQGTDGCMKRNRWWHAKKWPVRSREWSLILRTWFMTRLRWFGGGYDRDVVAYLILHCGALKRVTLILIIATSIPKIDMFLVYKRTGYLFTIRFSHHNFLFRDFRCRASVWFVCSVWRWWCWRTKPLVWSSFLPNSTRPIHSIHMSLSPSLRFRHSSDTHTTRTKTSHKLKNISS